jgi:hypothetical protein
MRVELCTYAGSEPDDAELRALRHWLETGTVRPGRITVRHADVGPDEMGAAADALEVALGPGGGALAGAVTTWLSTRRGNVKLRLRRPDGAELEVDATTEDSEATVKAFLPLVSTEG